MQSSSSPTKSPTMDIAFSEASGLLLLWSILVINEGIIRMGNLYPGAGAEIDLGASTSYNLNIGVLFIAAIAEVIFGFVGVFVGLAGFIFRYHNASVTKAAMAIQTVLGIFVFVVYVFVDNALKASNSSAAIALSLDVSEGVVKFLYVMGLFTAFHLCLALQGGQFLFMARTYAAATGEDFLKQSSGNKMRAMFWSGNLTLAGLWTLIFGSVVNSNVGSGKLSVVYAFPPHVGRLPGLVIVTGLFMIIFGGWSMSIPAKSLSSVYYGLWTFSFLFTWLNFTLIQFAFVGPAVGGMSMHHGLIFMLMFLGPYFVYRSNCDEELETKSYDAAEAVSA